MEDFVDLISQNFESYTRALARATAPVVLAAIEEFVTGGVAHTAERVMASVLFTDIVDPIPFLRGATPS